MKKFLVTHLIVVVCCFEWLFVGCRYGVLGSLWDMGGTRRKINRKGKQED